MYAPKMDRAKIYIQENLHNNVNLTEIVNEFGISYYHLCRLFRQSIGMTPREYLIQQRVELAKKLLIQRSDCTILDITNECGFANPSHFAKCFRDRVGVSPRQFRLMN